eukprot:CAMPEP_0119054734 /NCGR_PEP_ID=MMETSP1177-20130426/75273_1 /TAXON_ID=2985 /ORGANISM="Ochromonas sp, Strain CCMP1899" /LENGTH=225 /DNA_ID=CAMNT_0007035079 /DNA_START=901 /DNA_END=1578 /DNA_ORIENTATION=-
MVQMVIARAEMIGNSQFGTAKYTKKAFCITNATAPDNPIVYASPGFLELTGYDMHAILGHNCRFLQGPDTDRKEAHKLRVAIETGREEYAVIKNYKKNGTPFWNRVQVGPMRDKNGKITLVVGVQCEVDAPGGPPLSTNPLSSPDSPMPSPDSGNLMDDNVTSASSDDGNSGSLGSWNGSTLSLSGCGSGSGSNNDTPSEASGDGEGEGDAEGDDTSEETSDLPI